MNLPDSISFSSSSVDLGRQMLSDITYYDKYARYLPDLQRRQVWTETAMAVMEMHMRKYPQIKEEIAKVFGIFVAGKAVMPSMRTLQFAGRPIEMNNARVFNCSYMAMDRVDCFPELLFLLLAGCGGGFSVQSHHVGKLPTVRSPGRSKRYQIQDSIIGWAEAVRALVEAYFYDKPKPIFDIRDIRPEGTLLKTSGGRAPGGAVLLNSLERMEAILYKAYNQHDQKLRPINVHDMNCHAAVCVRAGGIRRSSLISFFDWFDEEMLHCKNFSVLGQNPQRYQANNSAVLQRELISKNDFNHVFSAVQHSGSGEPGFMFVNDVNTLGNPCNEISLENQQFCNLSTINGGLITSRQSFVEAATAASFIGTLQAGYTDFHYLSPEWEETTKRGALTGVSCTGISHMSLSEDDIRAGAIAARIENLRVSALIGINPADRVTAIKPEGTTSCLLGTSSGIHASYAPFYIRRFTLEKSSKLYKYLIENHSYCVVDSPYSHRQALMEIPQKTPAGSVLRSEPMEEALSRVLLWNRAWVQTGHRKGPNYNNVSATISVKQDDWDKIREWSWENRFSYAGISLLPYDGGIYEKAPFEEIAEAEYVKRYQQLKPLQLETINEAEDTTNLQGEAACAGGACEIV